jgi:hypothetical protein
MVINLHTTPKNAIWKGVVRLVTENSIAAGSPEKLADVPA